MTRREKYPIGQQSFEVLRDKGYVYVDKTRFIEEILEGSQYYFLARPRRFGKSLFLSTLKCFYEGKRHLFEGLYIDSIDWEWEPYPVLYIDLNVVNYDSPESLSILLENHLERWEEKYGVKRIAGSIASRFTNVIHSAYNTTGKRVVILVDEYDKPLVGHLSDKDGFERFRSDLAAFYANFKSCADFIELVFITGVSRFGKLSVFSGLNNIKDISFDNRFSDICGISGEELLDVFTPGIKNLAEANGQSFEKACNELKHRYDGYCFANKGKDIYNPYSLLNVIDSEQYGNYWIESGQPTILKDQLTRFNVDLESLLHPCCSIEALKGLDLDNPHPIALLYQTGYLTIKSYNPSDSLYTLGIPNKEVEEGFLMLISDWKVSK